VGWIQRQLFEYRRELLYAIHYAHSHAYGNSYAYADSYAYANAMHGKMHTDAQAAPDSAPPALITHVTAKQSSQIRLF